MTTGASPLPYPPLDVTVIVAAWNRAALVTRALDSIAAQTRLPQQVFVVDDASSDNSCAVVRQWIDRHDLPVTLISNTDNGGVAVARNVGMQQASTRYVAFLDSDDVWLPHALETLIAPLEANAEAVLCCADARVLGSSEDLPDRLFTPRLDLDRDLIFAGDPGLYELADPSQLLLLTSIIPTCSAAFRLDVARAVNWMPNFRTGEDWLFWLRLARQGRFLCRLEPVAEVLRHEANLTHSSRDAFTAKEHLRALLALKDGSLGIQLSAAEQKRVANAIAEKTGHWRYFLSRQGLGMYWQGLACPEGSATGGRLRHIVADPKSLARALLAHAA